MERVFTLEEASRLLGVSPSAIRLWERRGRIRCVQTPSSQRRVPENEIRRLRGEDILPPKPRVTALCARVSSHDQRAKGDLNRQIERLREGARQLGLPESEYVITDMASGLSDRRHGLGRLYGLRSRPEARRLVQAAKEAAPGAGNI